MTRWSTNAGGVGRVGRHQAVWFGVLIAALPMLVSSPARAQNCEDYWTAAYKCLEGCGPCPDDSRGQQDDGFGPPSPPPPAYDPRPDARNRVATLVANYGDIIDSASWSSIATSADSVFDSYVPQMHRELWRIMAEAQGEAAAQREKVASFAEGLKRYEEQDRSLNSTRDDGIPQELIDAKAAAMDKKAELEAEIETRNTEITADSQAVDFAVNQWLSQRNETLKILKSAVPDIQNIPDEAAATYGLPLAEPPFARNVKVDPEPEPLGLRRLPIYPYFGGVDHPWPHNTLPAPEPALPADLTGQITELEQAAIWARGAKQDLQAAKAATAAFQTTYNSYAEHVVQKQINADYAKQEVTFLNSQVARLRQQLEKVQLEEKSEAWMKSFDALRAEAWDIVKEKVIMPEVQKLPHYDDFERAKKVLDLANQVRNLEKDAELYSNSAAETLALGTASHTAEIAAGVWGATRQQAEASIDRTMALIDAPPDAAKSWKALLTSEP